MKQLKKLIVTVGFPIAAIAILLSVVPQWERRENWPVLFAYTLFTIVCSFSPVNTLNARLTLNSAVSISGILLYGTWIAAWSSLVETILLSFLFKVRFGKALTNLGNLLLTVWIVGELHTLLTELDVLWVWKDLPLLLVFWLVNTFLCAIGISHYYGIQFYEVFQNMLKAGTITYLLLMLMGSMGARLIEAYGGWALVLLATAFFALRMVFQQYYANMNNLQKKVEEIKQLHQSTLMALAASIDARDPYTHGHSYRVAYWGREIARALGLSSKQTEEVYYGGILHDIGKIGIEDEVLKKKGLLTADEYERIKAHTLIGYDILKRAGVFDELLPAIRSHHERMDGMGYPDGLRGTQIPLIARILAVSDAFDAMVSDRPYRKGLSVEEALRRIELASGTQFDPDIAEEFVRLVRKRSPEELESVMYGLGRGKSQLRQKEVIQ